jgi:arylsulfatase A-like enzyme
VKIHNIKVKAIILGLAILSSCHDKKPQPNLIFVFSDQLRRQALGFMNEDPVVTPNIDQFASEAQYFTQAVSNVPISSPFRAMLMTGRYPLSTGITTNLFPTHDYGLSENEITFGEVLLQAGYQNGYIGKWHLLNPEETLNLNLLRNKNSDEQFILPGPGRHGFHYWWMNYEMHEYVNPVYWGHNKEVVRPNQWSVDFETDKAIEFIQNRDTKKPFALFLSWGPPHPPFVVPQKYLDMYAGHDLTVSENFSLKGFDKHIMSYYAAVSWCDDNFGRLLRELEQEGLSDNTIVVFTSDHGEMLGSHGIFNEKTHWYEEAIGIPFLIRWPGKIPSGENNMLFPVHDFMPSILGLMDVTPPELVEGKDWSKNILGKNNAGPNSVFLAHYPYMAYDMPWADSRSQHPAIEQGLTRSAQGYGNLDQIGYRGVKTADYTYVFDRSPLDEPGISFNWASWDSCMQYTNPGAYKIQEFLYNNATDPYQTQPLALDDTKNAPILLTLRHELRKWLNKTHDPFILP